MNQSYRVPHHETGPSAPSGTQSPFVHSSRASSSNTQYSTAQRRFKSRRMKKEDIQRPWLGQKDPQLIWHLISPVVGIVLGFVITGFYIYRGILAAPNHSYCLILDETFSGDVLDPNIWTHEVQVGGFGNGQFEQTTATDENAFIKDGMLYLQPTLQNETLLAINNTIDLLNNGCTSTAPQPFYDCVATTNTTNGTIVNPVKSARINTKNSAAIKYGRIEVRAKLPVGDWLWPAIWMLPVNNTYGVWPASGEIDIVEARGNNYTYQLGGNNVAFSTLHWGPDLTIDRAYKTTAGSPQLHSTFPADFHTFGFEWNSKYLYTYIDNRVRQVLKLDSTTSLWDQGHFPPSWPNGSQIVNPWKNGTNGAPFDQPFYLILNLAVGGKNGWFGDGVAGKPWTDGSETAASEFWAAKNEWYPTWQKGGAQMVVDSVKIWQESGWMGCNA